MSSFINTVLRIALNILQNISVIVSRLKTYDDSQ